MEVDFALFEFCDEADKVGQATSEPVEPSDDERISCAQALEADLQLWPSAVLPACLFNVYLAAFGVFEAVLLQGETAGINKGEARNSLARGVFFNRLGEVRDRSFENQRHYAGGLNLVVAAIALWNTVHLERAKDSLANVGFRLSRSPPARLTAPLGTHQPHR